jgi:choline dehydrogenase-like flavoprotein
VVDTQLRVRGVQGLRVADASVAPFTPVSAMNAPSMMIGQRAATFMRAELDRARAVSSVLGSHAEQPPAATFTLAGASAAVEPGEGERAPWPG